MSDPAQSRPAPRRRPRSRQGPHNLPAPATALIGRERETARARDLLLQPAVRLVTLVGAPGIGKTRLGLAATEATLDHFADGAVFVPLAPLREPELVASAIARQVGVSEAGGRSLLTNLITALGGQRLLLVLDNFEHLPEAAPVVAELLAACPGLKVLATSRTPLHVYGERELPVPPLRLPDRARWSDPAAVSDSPAVALFVERARAIWPDFGLTDANVAAVVEICARLDGLPLAIELAAARVKLLPPAGILARLERLDLLSDASRDRPARHQSLRALIDWSHDLLSDAERALLRRLSVFAGGWTLDAAETVCGFGLASPALDLLVRLVDQSLVQAEECGGEVRYRLLETIRQYAEEELRESGEEVIVRDHHLDWFLALAERAEPGRWGPEQAASLAGLEGEHDNLRAALAWSRADPSRAETGLRLAGAARWFWDLRGHLSEGRGWLVGLLALVPRRTAARAKGLLMAGYLANLQGDDAGVALLEESLGVWQELGATVGVTWSQVSLGMALHLRGDDDRAEALLQEGLARAREAGHDRQVCSALYWLAEVAHARGAHGRAEAMHEENLLLTRRRSDHWNAAYPLTSLAYLASIREDYDRATALLEESLALRWELDDRRNVALCMEGLGWVAGVRGEAERAVRLLGAEDALRDRIGAARVSHWAAVHERALTAARAGLGEEKFAAAWAAGRAMTLEQAVAYALASEVPAPASPPGVTPPAAAARADSLSPREQEVAALIARGLSNRQIAAELVLSVRTVERHIENIYEKLGLRGRAARAAIATFAMRHQFAGSE